METENSSNTYHLEPGSIYVSTTGDVIRSVVGSYIVVCTWDGVKRIGGALCFLYPKVGNREKRTASYGDVAIPHLINLMEKSGASRERMVAQIFGGGSRTKELFSLPKKSLKLARKLLSKNGIEVVSEDVGGSMGRKILFDTASGHAAVLKVHDTREDDWF